MMDVCYCLVEMTIIIYLLLRKGMIQTILQIQNHAYPFEERSTSKRLVTVEDVQSFSSLKQLLEKKKAMQVKNKLIDSPYIIKMINIYQEDLTLHYFYEYVPYSLANYIQKCYKNAKADIVEMNAKLFAKRMSHELTLLIYYLARMKIEVNLSIHNLGITEDERLKIYMHARCRMGHKTELSLLALYGHCKEKIINYVESEFNLIRQKEEVPPNFVIKGNKLVFPQTLNESYYSSSNYQDDSIFNTTQNSNIFNNTQNSHIFNNTQNSNIFKSNANKNQSSASCIHPKTEKPFNIRQTQSPNGNRSYNFNDSKSRSAKTAPKNQKDFHFGAKKSKGERSNTDYQDDNSDAKSFSHSRSIRIELQQKVDPSERKRKDSYKVKITTFHEYEMEDCDPTQIFGGKSPKNEEDIFQHFARQGNAEAKQQPKKQWQQESEEEKEEEQDNIDEMGQIPSPGPFMRKESMPQYGFTDTSDGSTRNLQQKVRMIKEKAGIILNRYMKSKLKKTMSFKQ